MKKIWLFLIGIISLSLVSAQIYFYYNDEPEEYKEKVVQREYFEEDGITFTKANTIYVNYEDEDRLSTDKYKYGYTYRTSETYLKRYEAKHPAQIIVIKESDDEDDNSVKDEPYTYKKYFKYLDTYEEVTCYKTAPKGKFIYRKCPE